MQHPPPSETCNVDGGPSGGSSMRRPRPGNDDLHRRERKLFLLPFCAGGSLIERLLSLQTIRESGGGSINMIRTGRIVLKIFNSCRRGTLIPCLCPCALVTGPPIDLNGNCYRTFLDAHLTLLHLLYNNVFIAYLCISPSPDCT